MFLKIAFSFIGTEAGEIAQWFRALAARTENQSLFPRAGAGHLEL